MIDASLHHRGTLQRHSAKRGRAANEPLRLDVVALPAEDCPPFRFHPTTGLGHRQTPYRLDMHLDADEANAADLHPGVTGVLFKQPTVVKPESND